MSELTITISGDRAAGKTLLARLLVEFLTEKGYNLGRVREATPRIEKFVREGLDRRFLGGRTGYNGRTFHVTVKNGPEDSLAEELLDLSRKQESQLTTLLHGVLAEINHNRRQRNKAVEDHTNRFERDRVSELGSRLGSVELDEYLAQTASEDSVPIASIHEAKRRAIPVDVFGLPKGEYGVPYVPTYNPEV